MKDYLKVELDKQGRAHELQVETLLLEIDRLTRQHGSLDKDYEVDAGYNNPVEIGSR